MFELIDNKFNSIGKYEAKQGKIVKVADDAECTADHPVYLEFGDCFRYDDDLQFVTGAMDDNEIVTINDYVPEDQIMARIREHHFATQEGNKK